MPRARLRPHVTRPHVTRPSLPPSVITALTLALLFAAFGCRRNTDTGLDLVPPAAFAPWVAAFSSGLVSAHDPVEVQFTEAVPGAVAGAEADVKLLKLTPAVTGALTWSNPSTLTFTPEGPLPQNQPYTATLNLRALYPDVPDSLAFMRFGFQTLAQGLALDGVYLEPDPVSGERADLQLVATLRSFDRADAAQVEEAFTALQDARSLPVAWSHDADQRTHALIVSDVTRGAGAADVQLQWRGQPLGLSFDSLRAVAVPSLDSFVVTSMALDQEGDQRVRIFFSDPIDPTQDVRGLVGLSRDPDASVSVSGNVATVAPSARLAGDAEVFVAEGVRSVYRDLTTRTVRQTVAFRDFAPAVEMIGDGVIVPSTAGMTIPFRAVSLAAVDVRVVRIFSNNIGQFFQENELNGSYSLRRVGRQVFRGEIALRSDAAVDLHDWNTYALDLKKLVDVEPGAIYRVTIDFRQNQARYPCGDQPATAPNAAPPPIAATTNLPYQVRFASYDPEEAYYLDQEAYYDYDYDGSGQEPTPCDARYYRGKMRTRNFLASDIGLLAKRSGNGELLVVATDLRTAEPLVGLDVDLIDQQLQVQASAKTGGNGAVAFAEVGQPLMVVARRERERGYLRLQEALSTSTFDVAGESLLEGARGFLYAERGVWRPGDSIYVTLLVEREADAAASARAEGEPVRFRFVDPQGNRLVERVAVPKVTGMYDLRLATSPDAPTGPYLVEAEFRGGTVSKSIRVETVMPNRLKVDLGLGEDPVGLGDASRFTLSSRWLHGAVAGGLKADVEFSAEPATSPVFAKAATTQRYADFDFSDEARPFGVTDEKVFDGTLDAGGKASYALPVSTANGQAPPGMLRGRFVTRVFEPTGAFSTVTRSAVLSPYDVYIGMRVPDAKDYYGFLGEDRIPIELVALGTDGELASDRKVQVEVYNIAWSFWWERGDDNDLSSYVQNRAVNLALETTVALSGGRATWQADLSKLPYGRKLVRVIDPLGGHATSATLYIQDPRWAWDVSSRPGGAELLSFTLDKEDYAVDETARVALPAFPGGRALVSVERGDRVLSYRWVEGRDTPQDVEVDVTEEMHPNAYVSVSLLQPHAQTVNDQPIRLFGVQPMNVTSTKTRLQPAIAIRAESDPKGAELAPEEGFTVTVSESTGQPMSYTLDVVEEGLLDLTSYRTPDPYARFHERLALGVLTYDLYRYVLGAFDGKLAGMLAVGGDGNAGERVDPRANRFRPVVKHLGPFRLAPGEKASHALEMPNYVGSVRVMVVAGEGRAFGSAETTRPVRRPLMVLATLPRVVSPGETIELPVTVFASDPKIRGVDVKLEGLELLTAERSVASTRFAEPGEQIVRFRLRAPEKLGVAKIRVVATGGGFTATDAIELDVRAPNPRTTQVVAAVVEPGETWSGKYAAFGVPGTNEGRLEISGNLPLNLESRLDYLIDYPHGCIEQTISKAFPQLYLADLLELPKTRATAVQRNVESTLAGLTAFRRSDGAFSYWPGDRYLSNWATNYAGHFLLEAEAKGYRLPAGIKDAWLEYQRRSANAWTPALANTSADQSELIQAYRLLTLALAKKPQLGAMNRLKGTTSLTLPAVQMLAAAYGLAGQAAAAQQVLAKASQAPAVERNADYEYYTYGSALRDEAIGLYCTTLLNDRTQAFKLARSISAQLSDSRWHSTQTTAWALLAMSKYADGEDPGQPLSYSYALGNASAQPNTQTSDLRVVPLPGGTAAGQPLTIKNTSGRKLFVRIVSSGIAPAGNAEVIANAGLRLDVTYVDGATGKAVDVAALPQGRDIQAQVRVTNLTARRQTHLALTQLFPSGWEIRNRRLEGGAAPVGIEYQDVRDDRVLSYFDLMPSSSVTVTTSLNATYAGDFYLPQVYAEAMYDNDVRARSAGRRVAVTQGDGGAL